ncbi:MAG: hypothetical protein EZS28_005319 [Streblomastix strix]|uniref:Uncharacterized protein n=1 Tax=Streblomastix strix TaxID=222440 RepID=A0A5J4WXF2_9EUKA|nr:MAG: hypothetical protein EZS28_005319 [Streblomastix strix]
MKSQRQTTAKFRPGAQRSVQANQNSQKQPKQDQKKEKVNKEEQRHIPPPPSYTPPKPVIQSSQTIPSLPISYYSPIIPDEKQRVRHDIELLKAKLLHLEAEEAEILSRKEQAETQVTEAVKQAGLGEQLTKYKTQSEQAERRKIENERQSDEVLQSEILSDKTKNKENDEYQKDNKANSDFKVMEIKHAQLQERVRVLSNEISGSTTLHLVELEGEKQAAIASKNFRAAQRITLEITEARKQKEILETQLIVARNDLSLNEQELSKIDEVQTQRQQYLERGPIN